MTFQVHAIATKSLSVKNLKFSMMFPATSLPHQPQHDKMLSRSRHRMPREAKIEYLVMNVDRQPVVTAFK